VTVLLILRRSSLHSLGLVDDDVLEMGCAGQRRQVIASQIAPSVVANAEVGHPIAHPPGHDEALADAGDALSLCHLTGASR
jgi:hypothetical protein